MTTTYTNITLTGVTQAEAAAWLAENAAAAVSPNVDDITVIYDNVLADHAGDDEPLDALLKLTSEISYELGCAAWLVIVDDDSALIYSLYADGELADGYGAAAGKPLEGGDAEKLAGVFGLPKQAIKVIRGLLKREIASATERHAALLEALELPPLALRSSYASIQAGKLPPGVGSRGELVFVTLDTGKDTGE